MPRRDRGSTAAGFRERLLQRLRNRASDLSVAPRRLHQQIAFERLLARLSPSDQWVLKGGFALQLRLGLHTRATVDIDLLSSSRPAEALNALRQAAAASSDDHFSFEIAQIAQELQGAPGGTVRATVMALVAGRELLSFHVDISSGDVLTDPPELLRGSDLLDFAGIAPIEFPAYPVAQHLAEKLHAYTLPRARENTRVKDLIDLAIVAATEHVSADQLQRSVRATFDLRASHAVPQQLPAPPASWEQPFMTMASEVVTPRIHGLTAGHTLAAAFWNPFLAQQAVHCIWEPARRRWIESQSRHDEAE